MLPPHFHLIYFRVPGTAFDDPCNCGLFKGRYSLSTDGYSDVLNQSERVVLKSTRSLAWFHSHVSTPEHNAFRYIYPSIVVFSFTAAYIVYLNTPPIWFCSERKMDWYVPLLLLGLYVFYTNRTEGILSKCGFVPIGYGDPNLWDASTETKACWFSGFRLHEKPGNKFGHPWLWTMSRHQDVQWISG